MDWPNERFVKLYTRDTDDWLLLPWQARAIFTFVLRKVDRAGVLETKRGPLGVAALIGAPADVVESALAALLADGCVAAHPRGFVVPNFLEAQDAAQSDKLRAQASRERRRLGAVTEGHAASHAVTIRDESSRGVTRRHAASLQTSQTNQTRESEALAERSPALPLVLEGDQPAEARPGAKLDARAAELATFAIGEINARAGTTYRPTSEQTAKDARVLAREGATREQAERVIAAKWSDWGADPKMRAQFKPSVLLRPANFRRYVEELEATTNARPRPGTGEIRTNLQPL